MAQDEKDKLLGYAFNYIGDFGAGQQVQITGSLPLEATQKQFEDEFTKIRNAVEKQRTRSSLRDLEDKIVAADNQLASLKETLEEADARHKDAKNIPNNERIAREQTVTGIKHWQKELDRATKLLAERKKELE